MERIKQMAKDKIKLAEILILCPICEYELGKVKEGRSEGQVLSCRGCGNDIVIRAMFVAPLEKEVEEDKPLEKKEGE